MTFQHRKLAQSQKLIPKPIMCTTSNINSKSNKGNFNYGVIEGRKIYITLFDINRINFFVYVNIQLRNYNFIIALHDINLHHRSNHANKI